MGQPPSWARIGDDGVILLRVKAVPGARRDEIAGVLGEGGQARLKIRVSAPPEGGKANKAICKLVATALGVKPRDVRVAAGQTNPEKTLRVEGIEAERLLRLLEVLE
ncbi:MAG: DUF167 domain-containing protein [Phycisphaeraceae bacterium]|nr:DUF167 domain-containing protein [Phycisphaeraceae bacterium]